MRNPFVHCRRLLIWLVAAQLLNLSICGDVYDDFSRFNSTADPTESVVEWLAEMHYGQLPAFNYSHSLDTHKGPAKSMHWHVARLHYILTTATHPSFACNMRVHHPLLYSRLADRSLDRPPKTA